MKLLIAGGGTGGHLFPAIALAEEIKGKDPEAEIIFAGARGGLEERILNGTSFRLKLFDVTGIKRKGLIDKIYALLKVCRATIGSILFLIKEKPDGVVGSGSYSSAPVVLAGILLGKKAAILEQNAVPGLTNRILGKFVRRIYISFEESREYFPRGKTIFTGNPVRREILGKVGERVTLSQDKFTIFVFGGSQGATAINSAFLDSTEYLTKVWNDIEVIHQTGDHGFDAAKASYERKGLNVELTRFVEDMAEAYSKADLVICRAGATTIAEITAFGLPSILVPYPFASDGHQEANARCLADKGAAVIINQDNLTGATLAAAIKGFYRDRRTLKAMCEEVRRLAKPDAAESIARDYMKLIA